MIKKMVVDKDKAMKSLKESHEKEVALIRLDKQSSEEALGCATRENIAMKDKENTLIDIFKRMKTYIDNYHGKPQGEVSNILNIECEKCEQKFTTEHCDFKDNKEDNVHNHMIVTHKQFKCHLCDFISGSGENLDSHLTEEHFKPKFTCNKCDLAYHTERMLKEHINRIHRQNRQTTINCDYCGCTVPTFTDLDQHINTHHKSRPNNIIKTTSPVKTYSFQEQLKNGPCLHWNKNSCKYGDLCKYAHIEICRFQERCRSPHDCSFFHFNHSNINFLESSTFRKTFRLNLRDFPTLREANRNSLSRRR